MAETDTRIVVGARCSWWGSIHEVGNLPGGLPCCPVCKGVLFEYPDEVTWWWAIDDYARRSSDTMPDYRAIMEWLRGKHFATFSEALQAYRAGHSQ